MLINGVIMFIQLNKFNMNSASSLTLGMIYKKRGTRVK